MSNPKAIEVTIGWTRSDLANGYSSFDGYRPGASQHTETITLDTDGKGTGIFAEVPTLEAVEQIAEACFVATNAPFTSGLAAEIAEQIAQTGYHGQGAHYSLSVGDTVTVGEVMVSCERTGWQRVAGAHA